MRKSIQPFLKALGLTAGALLIASTAQADVLFEDGFESGDASAGGWTSTGQLTVDTTAYTGDYAARIDDSGTLQKVVSTVGFSGIELRYARYTYGYDFGEALAVEWSTDGASWNTVELYAAAGWGLNAVQLDSSAAGQPTLYVRFRSNASGWLERFRVDDFALLGTPEDGGGGGGEPPPPPPPPSPSCLPPVGSYTAEGPFDFATDDVGPVNIWVPEGLPAGCRVPVIHLANGTGARCSTYASTLRHFASHGFVATCYESTSTGQGTQAVEAIEVVIDRYPDLVDTKYGFTGHSQGGGGAILGVYRAEQEWGSSASYAGFGIEPAHGFGDSPSNWATLYGQIESPVAMFNGSRDSLVSASWVRQGYNALDNEIEKAWYEAVGAGHVSPVPNSYASEFGLAWFRWQLLGDSAACEYFRAMPNQSDWRLQETDNLSPCN